MTFLSFWKRVVAEKLRTPSFRFFSGERVGKHETNPPLFRSRFVLALLLFAPLAAPAQPHFNGAKALEYARQFVAIGPRWPTSPGHAKAEEFLRSQFKHDQLEEDTFTADTPIGPVPMRNFIVRFPGKKDGVIVLATHYETNYWLRNINFVGANDGGSTTGLLLAIADQLRAETAGGKKLDGYSVWLLFDDGEEAIESKWTDSDSLYGTRHLAAKWARDGTLGRIKAFILADMIGDKDLDILRESRSADWLVALMTQGRQQVRLRSPLFSDRRGCRRRSPALRQSRRAFDRRDRPGLRP